MDPLAPHPPVSKFHSAREQLASQIRKIPLADPKFSEYTENIGCFDSSIPAQGNAEPRVSTAPLIFIFSWNFDIK